MCVCGQEFIVVERALNAVADLRYQDLAVSGRISHLKLTSGSETRGCFPSGCEGECYPGKIFILGVEIQLFPALYICVTHT